MPYFLNEEEKVKRKINVGVVGMGIGWYHCDIFRKVPEANIMAICDANPERANAAQKEFGATYKFTKYEDMLKVEELEAIVIGTPNFLHKPMTIAALKSGKNVLCEKPMALNSREAKEMVDTAKKEKKKLMVHFNYRYVPECQFLKKYVEEGNLGKIYFAKTAYLRRRGIPTRQWFTVKSQAGGGALFDIGIHCLDLALWLLGHPKPVSVSGVTYCKFGNKLKNWIFDVDDFASGFIKFANGVTLFIETCWAANTQDSLSLTLLGDKAGVLRNGGGIKIFGEENGNTVDITPANYPPCINAQQEFINAILEDREPSASGIQGLQTMKILDAIARSSKSKKEVTFRD